MISEFEILARLVEINRAAIKSGEWKVASDSDVEFYLSIAEARLEQNGWRTDGIAGETWIEDL